MFFGQRYYPAIATVAALASAIPALSARAETPTDAEARRFGSLLDVGARAEANGRLLGGWTLVGFGAGAMGVAPFMIANEDDDVRTAGWWTLGFGGVTAGLGAATLAITGSLEDLREAWNEDRSPIEERLARFELTLAEMADSARDSRVITGTIAAVLGAGFLGWGLYEATRDDSSDGAELSLMVTGGFSLSAGLYLALAGESQLESLHAAWESGRPGAEPTVTLSPTFGLGPNGGFLGLAGGF